MWERLERSALQNREWHTLLWTKQFLHCLCSVRFKKKEKDKMLNAAEKKKIAKCNKNKTEGKILWNISHNATYCLFPPQCPCLSRHTPHATGKCGVKRQSTAVAASRNTGGDKACVVCVAPPARAAEAALLLWSLPQTRLRTAPYCTGRQFFLVCPRSAHKHRHTHPLRRCRLAESSPNVRTHEGKSVQHAHVF